MNDLPVPTQAVGFDRTKAVEELLTQAPEAAVERLRTLADDLKLAYAPNTLRTWRADWRVWTAYCETTSRPALPATLETIKAFLLDRIAAGRKRATLEHYLATLTVVHRLVQLPSPMDAIEARLMWRGLRREHLVQRQRQAQGLTLDDVERLISPLSRSVPRDVRDAALLRVAFETMFRRSELVHLQAEHFTVEPDGSGRVFLPHSKTDQEGEGVLQYLSPATVDLVLQWMGMANITGGPLFRSTPRSNQPDRYRNPLSDRDVARIFKRLALASGMDNERISGHSTRVGAAQDLLSANFSAAEIMRQGRWKSDRMVVKYGENLEAGRGAMAQLIGRRSHNA
jgi:integrase